MSQFKNIFIFVSDALSYSFLPDQLAEMAESEPVRTLAPSHHSAKSFASIVTGLEASSHSVDSFGEKLEEDTVLDMFSNSNLFDHPDSSIRYMLDLYENPDLDEMEEPFVWVERSLETHIPYGEPGHNHIKPEGFGPDGNYFEAYSHREIVENYTDSAEKSMNHFLQHVQELKDRGLYENTLIIFTADHGEAMGQKVFGRTRYGHNSPGCHYIAEVPTVFFNHKVEADRMRSVDIIPTALHLLDKEWVLDTDGVNLHEELPSEGECPTAPNLIMLNWRWNKRKERWELKPKSKIKSFLEDHYPERLMRKFGLGAETINFGGDDE